MTKAEVQQQLVRYLAQVDEEYNDDLGMELIFYVVWDDVVGYMTLTFNDPRIPGRDWHYDPPLHENHKWLDQHEGWQ
jgi:hypothetical protein